LLVGACSEGNDALKNAPPDLAEAVDMSAEQFDMTDVDLQGPTCGAIVICLATQCGFTNLTCDQGCTAGAGQAAVTQAGSLAACTALNCLGSLGAQDGGGLSGMLAIIGCMTMKCSGQVNACEGFPFAGQ
jgi:hypothetical protein